MTAKAVSVPTIEVWRAYVILAAIVAILTILGERDRLIAWRSGFTLGLRNGFDAGFAVRTVGNESPPSAKRKKRHDTGA